MVGLMSAIHKVLGKLIKTVDQGGPWIVFWQKDNHLADFFYENIISGEPEIFGQPYRLAAAIDEYFCGLHGTPPTDFDRYQSIYLGWAECQ